MTTTTTTMAATTATYTRLNSGAWGLRSTGALTPGQQVEVRTRDGRVKTETVGAIAWSRDGVTVAMTARDTRSQQSEPVRETPAPRVPQPAGASTDLDRVIRDLETALAGLRALRAQQAAA